MSVVGYEKWDRYKIGSVSWINARRTHPHRKIFVDSVDSMNINSVLEVGAGELIEYQQIKENNPDIVYTVVDVSDVFLGHCKSTFPEVHTFKMPMEEISVDVVGRHDMVYVASILEHSKDVSIAVSNLMSVGNHFRFVLFKWNYEGNLVPKYQKRKKYWSSEFNIRMLLDKISKYGTIEGCDVAKAGGGIVNFEKYSSGRSGICRTGDYLMISGKCGH